MNVLTITLAVASLTFVTGLIHARKRRDTPAMFLAGAGLTAVAYTTAVAVI